MQQTYLLLSVKLILNVAYRAPLTYNFHVTRELLKQVYAAERLQPPHWTTVVNTYNTLWTRVTNPAYLRGLGESGEWKKVGIYAVEAYGIFKVCKTTFRMMWALLIIFSDWRDCRTTKSRRLQPPIDAYSYNAIHLPDLTLFSETIPCLGLGSPPRPSCLRSLRLGSFNY